MTEYIPKCPRCNETDNIIKNYWSKRFHTFVCDICGYIWKWDIRKVQVGSETLHNAANS